MSVITDIIKQVVLVQRSIPGILVAYDNPPESLDKTPAFVTYPQNLDVDWPRSPSVRGKTYDIAMDLYISKAGSLANANAAAMPFIDLVPDTFDQNITLGGAALTAGVVGAQIGKLSYADVDYYGIRFSLKAIVKQQVIYKA